MKKVVKNRELPAAKEAKKEETGETDGVRVEGRRGEKRKDDRPSVYCREKKESNRGGNTKRIITPSI
jgi:hypothetical protein